MEKTTSEQIRIWGEKITESDREAFDSLFRFMYPRLVHFAFRYTKSKAVASDIVQDAFVTLWEKRRELQPERSVKAYMYQIVRNRSLNHIRDHSNETVGLELLNNSKFESDEQVSVQDPPNPLLERLKAWIEELPSRQQEAFKLSRFEGLDHDEIAEVMSISSNTVNNHIVAALDALRSRYDLFQQEINNV